MSNSKKHNKRSNTALLHHCLVRKVTECLVRGEEELAEKTCKLVKENFVSNKELSNELKLAKSIIDFKGGDSNHAHSILSRVRDSIVKIDENNALQQKRKLLSQIEKIDKNLLDNHIDNYKIYATIGTLFSEWRKPSETQNLALVSDYERTVLDWMIQEKSENGNVIVSESDDMSMGERRALLSTMCRKMEEKWGKRVLPSQREILRAVVAEDSDRFQKTAIESVLSLHESIKSYSNKSNSDKSICEKATELANKLTSMTPDIDNDALLASLLECCEITNELNKASSGSSLVIKGDDR